MKKREVDKCVDEIIKSIKSKQTTLKQALIDISQTSYELGFNQGVDFCTDIIKQRNQKMNFN